MQKVTMDLDFFFLKVLLKTSDGDEQEFLTLESATRHAKNVVTVACWVSDTLLGSPCLLTLYRNPRG